MKCLTSRWELCLLNYNCGHADIRGFCVLAVGLNLNILRTFAAGRQHFHLANCLWEENLGWIDSWVLNTEKLSWQ
jgi:hypothetical protein